MRVPTPIPKLLAMSWLAAITALFFWIAVLLAWNCQVGSALAALLCGFLTGLVLFSLEETPRDPGDRFDRE